MTAVRPSNSTRGGPRGSFISCMRARCAAADARLSPICVPGRRWRSAGRPFRPARSPSPIAGMRDQRPCRPRDSPHAGASLSRRWQSVGRTCRPASTRSRNVIADPLAVACSPGRTHASVGTLGEEQQGLWTQGSVSFIPPARPRPARRPPRQASRSPPFGRRLAATARRGTENKTHDRWPYATARLSLGPETLRVRQEKSPCRLRPSR